MRILLSMLVLLALTSCVSAPPPRAPLRPVAPPPPVVALPAPAPLASDWRDWPQTPGGWGYSYSADRSTATFGAGTSEPFALQCLRTSRRILLTRRLAEGGPVTLRTSTAVRVIPFLVEGASSSAQLNADDPLLDAIAFSRGRFTVEQAGRPPLVLPTWAEVDRVIEDCRS